MSQGSSLDYPHGAYCVECDVQRPVFQGNRSLVSSHAQLVLAGMWLGANLIWSFAMRRVLGDRCAVCGWRIIGGADSFTPEQLQDHLHASFWTRYRLVALGFGVLWLLCIPLVSLAPLALPPVLGYLGVVTAYYVAFGFKYRAWTREHQKSRFQSKQDLMESIRDLYLPNLLF